MAQRTRRIEFRLNPDYDEEKEALEIIEGQIGQGVSSRHFITDAILAFKGKKVQERGTNRDVMRRLNSIERKIDEQTTILYEQIVRALQTMDLSAYVNVETGRSIEQELGGKLPKSAYKQVFETIQSEEFEV
jgi:hypothetical protein